MQLEDISKDEEEVGKDTGEYVGSRVMEKLCLKEERGKEGEEEELSSDSLSKVMISLQ